MQNICNKGELFSVGAKKGLRKFHQEQYSNRLMNDTGTGEQIKYFPVSC